MKKLVNKAAYKYFLNLKETHSKLDEIVYSKFELQPYLTTEILTQKQKELLYLLRSKCHSSKMNFRKLHRANLTCIFQCPVNEDQRHAFSHCQSITNRIKHSSLVQYEQIFGPLHEQIEAMKIYSKIELLRIHTMKRHVLPGELPCQDPCTFHDLLNGAADFISS